MAILVADDDAETCLLVSAILEGAGHPCIVARDAMQVMHMAVHHRPSLIVLDLAMPAGTGIGALEKLKRSRNTTEIPVIVLSGARDPAVIRKVVEMGALRFLPKPVDPDALLDAVGRIAEPSAAS